MTVNDCLQGERVYPCARVTLSPGQPTSFPGFSPTRPTEQALSLRRAGGREPWERGCRSTLPALPSCFVMRDIVCNVQHLT